MAFSARDTRAIGYAAKKYDYRLSLRSFPYAFFIRKDDNTTVKLHISDVLAIYDQGRKEDTKERARLRHLKK
jgi:hypothetical protein